MAAADISIQGGELPAVNQPGGSLFRRLSTLAPPASAPEPEGGIIRNMPDILGVRHAGWGILSLTLLNKGERVFPSFLVDNFRSSYANHQMIDCC